MYFEALGTVEVRAERDGEPRTPRPLKIRALLALLLLREGHVVTSARLVEELWSAEPPPTARAALQGYVAKLRRHLAAVAEDGSDPVRTHPGGYRLDLTGHRLDARRFRELCGLARDAEADGDPRAASGLLAEAEGLWRGAALADVCGTAHLARAAAQLDEARTAARARWFRLELALGRHTEIVGQLTELIGENPLHERLHGELMTALYLSGRTAEALMTYRRLHRLLAEELGMEPGEDLKLLHAAILTRDPALGRAYPLERRAPAPRPLDRAS
ncbi:BTAD domain-containing putative transcriptional regulator [Streptomyces sp. NPDC048172]|uniref:AfsR/SARP family transcriptional regulator n=1 Tax=Streptomyces sp. NPDC048172 TaxID=3365505 RepID=UPI00371EF1B1